MEVDVGDGHTSLFAHHHVSGVLHDWKSACRPQLSLPGSLRASSSLAVLCQGLGVGRGQRAQEFKVKDSYFFLPHSRSVPLCASPGSEAGGLCL